MGHCFSRPDTGGFDQPHEGGGGPPRPLRSRRLNGPQEARRPAHRPPGRYPLPTAPRPAPIAVEANMSFDKKLNSDELGEKGEAVFRSLCADVKLVCNKAERDRTGWDFIVEFPFERTREGRTLDARSAPLSCHIQQKTVWKGNDRIKIRLSSAERLAKELKPSFFYVLQIDEELGVSGAWLIHLIDGPLGLILKRLRSEEKKGNTKINSVYITFDVSKVGSKIMPTGQALREAILDACGEDVHGYLNKKQDQLLRLGFDFGCYKTELTLQVESERELVDTFLGIRQDAVIKNIKTFETRFGVSLPAEPTSQLGGKLNVETNSSRYMHHYVSQTAYGSPLRFQWGSCICPKACSERPGSCRFN